MAVEGNEDLTERVAALVSEYIARTDRGIVLSADEDVREAGLTSLDQVALVIALESEFKVSIPRSHLTVAAFSSIVAMARTMAAVMAEVGAKPLQS